MGQLVMGKVQSLPMAESWDLPSRQRVMRSHAAALIENGAGVEEISTAITDDLRSLLPAAIIGLRHELACPAQNDDFEDALTLELGKYLKLAAGGWPAGEKQEWLIQATEELCEYPLGHLIPALKTARRRQPWANKLVPEIVEHLEPIMARLNREQEVLMALSEIAKQ